MPLRKKKSSPPPQKNGRSWKNSNAPARWTGARRGFTARRCRGVWKRKMAGNNRKLRENQNGLGRIRLSDLRSETFCAYPLNKAGFGTVFALPERFEHILPRAKSAIKCSGKILAKALKRGCGSIFLAQRERRRRMRERESPDYRKFHHSKVRDSCHLYTADEKV